ncbi:MAG: MATE family efflux transporter [Gammaproteobacteria bacterium]|nr:MATE family efflux transporter [Gammaproteobacteria bacterium]
MNSLASLRSLLPTRDDHVRLWRIAGPMTLTGLAIPLLGMVDTFVMGHLEAAYYLGAVAVGSTLIQLLFWGVGFLRMSSTALAAQASHDPDKTRLVLLRSLLSAVLISAMVVLLREPLQHFSYTLLALEEEINLHSRLYFEICIWSMPAVLLNMVIWGWCLGMQNARAPLYLALWINAINIVLDIVFVFHFGLQTRGVAYAFLVANYSGMLLGAWILWRMLRPMPRMTLHGLWDARAWKNLFVVNHHLFVRTVLLLFSFAFFMAQGADFGAVVLAANAVLINFFYITAYGMDGFAHGLEALCGRAVGMRDRQLFERVVVSALFWCLLIGIFLISIFAGAGMTVIGWLTSLPEVQSAASLYLPWLVVLPVFCLLPFLLDGLFIGTTRTREMRNSMVLSILIYLLLWFVTEDLGNHGLWLALTSFMVARGLTLGYYSWRIERDGGFVPRNLSSR